MVYIIIAHMPVQFKRIFIVWAVKMMDYYEIGQRIRKFRKARGLSQEQLAERVGISMTHMSHIETANTKLSLPVFVQLAEALEVQTDLLLYDQPPVCPDAVVRDIAGMLEECDGKQARIVREIVRTTLQAFKAYL